MTRTFRLTLAAALALVAISAQAQSSTSASAPAAHPPAAIVAPGIMPAAVPNPVPNPDDVASVDSIIAALYDVISGPVGAQRDWNRFYSLFTPNARMMPIIVHPDGTVTERWITLNEYRSHAEKRLMEMGFFENEKARSTEQFGQLVHAFSTYEGRKGSPTAEPFTRGVNSIQVVNDGKRWWIASIAWRGEDDKLKLPARYLQSR